VQSWDPESRDPGPFSNPEILGLKMVPDCNPLFLVIWDFRLYSSRPCDLELNAIHWWPNVVGRRDSQHVGYLHIPGIKFLRSKAFQKLGPRVHTGHTDEQTRLKVIPRRICALYFPSVYCIRIISMLSIDAFPPFVLNTLEVRTLMHSLPVLFQLWCLSYSFSYNYSYI